MAQLVEQLIRNQQAAGSSPASSSRPRASTHKAAFGAFIYGFAPVFIVISIL